MIPRSDRVFFHIDGSPPTTTKNPPPSLAKIEAPTDMQSPIATTTSTTRWTNNSKRITITKDPRKTRPLAPATPWRPRISRKTPTATLEEHDEQPSPLDRKIPSTIVPLKLGVKAESGVLSSAPTSATLAPGCEKEEKAEVKEGGAEVKMAAPRVEQREEWQPQQADRWGMLRSDSGIKAAGFEREHVHPQTRRPGQQQAYQLPPHSMLGLSEPPYQASVKREACLDMNNDTNIYVNGLPKE